jgi:DNA polymerase-1
MLRIRKYIEREIGMRQKFNWNKRDHLILLLHKHLGIPQVHDTPGGGASTSKDSLKDYAELYPSKILHALMKGRKLETELRYTSSYYDWADENGYIHSNLNITGTRETRQSSTSPNQQNITGKLKELFQPPPGYVWMEADFANIELRIWAYAVGNKDLIEAFESGKSVHFLIMEALYPRESRMYAENPTSALKKLYRDIKAGNFAIIYGASITTSDKAYGYPGATAKVYERFPGVKEFTDTLIKQCEENRVYLQRHAVMTLGGYLLDVPTDEPFKACNYYVQGSAGIVTARAMIAISNNERYIDSESRMNAQIHDMVGIQIPIHPGLETTVNSIAHSMETCVMDIFGPTPIDYNIKYHPQDEDNPHLSFFQLPF